MAIEDEVLSACIRVQSLSQTSLDKIYSWVQENDEPISDLYTHAILALWELRTTHDLLESDACDIEAKKYKTIEAKISLAKELVFDARDMIGRLILANLKKSANKPGEKKAPHCGRRWWLEQYEHGVMRVHCRTPNGSGRTAIGLSTISNHFLSDRSQLAAAIRSARRNAVIFRRQSQTVI